MAIKIETLEAAARRDPKLMLGEGPPTGEEELGEGPDAYVEGIPDDIVELDDMAEDAVDTSHTLAGIAQAVSDTLGEPQGGLSEPTATALSVAVESFTKDLGFAPRIFPNLHHFSNVAIRPGATQMVLEDLKETMNKIGMAIAAALRKILEGLRALVEHVRKSMQDVEGKARQIKRAAADVANRSGVHITTPAWAVALSVKGMVPVNRDMITAFKKHRETLDEIMSVEESLVRLGCNSTEQALKVATETDKVEHLMREGSEQYWKALPGGPINSLTNKEVRTYGAELVFGDKTYYSTADAVYNPNGAVKHYSRVLKATENGQRTIDPPETIPAFTTKEISELMDLVMEDTMAKAMDRDISELSRTIRYVEDMSKHMRSSLSQGAGANKSGALIYSFIQGCLRVVYSGSNQLMNYDTRVKLYIMQLCVASTAAHASDSV